MSRLLPLTIFPFLSLMLANLSASAAPLSAEAEGARDQGIVYFEQELYPRAKEQLLRAVAAPGGSEDFRSAYFLAQTNYKLLMVEEAFQSLSRARSLAQSDQEPDLVACPAPQCPRSPVGRAGGHDTAATAMETREEHRAEEQGQGRPQSS